MSGKLLGQSRHRTPKRLNRKTRAGKRLLTEKQKWTTAETGVNQTCRLCNVADTKIKTIKKCLYFTDII